MMGVGLIWEWIKARLSLFRPAELAVLKAVAESLPSHVRASYDAQLRTINNVQRHTKGREVNLYHTEGGKAHFDEKLLFRNRGSEVLFAKVAVRVTGSSEPLKAQVWLTSGRVFSITFDRPPSFGSAECGVIAVQVLVDPEQPVAKAVALDPGLLGGKLAEWHRAWHLDDVRPPLADEERRKRAQDLEIAAPSDYEEILTMTDGFNVAGWHVHGLAEARSIIVDLKDTLFVLAENDHFGCLVASSQHPGELRLIHYDGPTIEDAGSSFISAMEMLLAGAGRDAAGQQQP